jgi:hypothetical protein
MTYPELSSLPDGVVVRLADGRSGRIAAWYHTQRAVGVRVDGGTVVVLAAGDVDWDDDGRLVEIRGD